MNKPLVYCPKCKKYTKCSCTKSEWLQVNDDGSTKRFQSRRMNWLNLSNSLGVKLSVFGRTRICSECRDKFCTSEVDSVSLHNAITNKIAEERKIQEKLDIQINKEREMRDVEQEKLNISLQGVKLASHFNRKDPVTGLMPQYQVIDKENVEHWFFELDSVVQFMKENDGSNVIQHVVVNLLNQQTKDDLAKRNMEKLEKYKEWTAALKFDPGVDVLDVLGTLKQVIGNIKEIEKA